MNLSEALEELRGNLLRDDAELASGPDDRLWTTKTLVRYLNDAQVRWASGSLTLRDGDTPEVVEVALEEGERCYSLHKSVRAVISARYDTQRHDLIRSGHCLLQGECTRYDDAFDVNSCSTGAPLAYTTDERLDMQTDAGVVLTIYGTPGEDQDGKIIRLRTARLPLRKLTPNKLNAQLEVPDEYCLDMLGWAAFRALSTSDIDGHSALAEKHKNLFEAAMRRARTDTNRKLGRRIGFGFGSSGTTWER